MTADRAVNPLKTFKRRQAPGFTLLEILLVLSLFVIVAGLAWPAIENRLGAAQLPESADRFRSLLYLTRSAAMMDHHRFRIRFMTDVRDPIVEFEPDPIGRPGEWLAATADWAVESPLLQGAHVHDVIPGRPAYLTPVSSAPPEEEVGVETTTDLNEAQAADTFVKGPDPMKDEQVDEKRPNILFETDGSTDWATIVLAEVPSSEPLEESMRQFWVVVDGRTGLATVREGITDEELAGGSFAIPREKLVLPKTKDVTDRALGGTSPESGIAGLGALGLGDGGGAGAAASPSSEGGLEQLQEMNAESGQSSSAEVAAGEDASAGPSATEGASGATENADESSTTMEELEQRLAETNLSEEEKEEIRKTFRNQGSGTKRGG
jgi:prepilin-type N-terminal cleavage/methylation domain-containing protein